MLKSSEHNLELRTHIGIATLVWAMHVHVVAASCALNRISLERGHNMEAEALSRLHTPVIIDGLTANWPAMTSWATPEAFSEIAGDMRVFLSANDSEPGEDGDASVTQYLTGDALRDWALFDFGTEAIFTRLCHSYPLPAALGQYHHQNFFSLGRSGTGSSMHSHDANWVAQIAGRKAWILIAPGVQQNLDSVGPCEVLQNHSKWPELQMQICTVLPGEVIFLPDLWQHAVCNLDEFTLAVGGRGRSGEPSRRAYQCPVPDQEL